MKFAISASVAFLAAVTSAAPALPTTTVQFTNDQSGRNANVIVPLAGTQSIALLLQGTSLDVNHQFYATSLFLQANFQDVQCSFELAQSEIVINEQKTFAQIDPHPVDLVNAQITCFAV